jgi:hypothetical protein
VPSFVVSYDLVQGTPEEYAALHDALRTYDAWGRITESTWVVVGQTTALAIRAHLQSIVPQGSRLFVARSAGEGAWSNLFCNTQWLREHL